MSGVNRILAMIVLLLPASWALFYISQAMNVLQEVTLDGERLVGRCYFGRQFSCVASDIKSITYYPLTWKIRYINFFDPKIPGINIALQNGKLFRINARTEGFSNLVDALKTFSKASVHIRCEL